jgi:hypothetical protein
MHYNLSTIFNLLLGSNGSTKPGSCARPVNGRRKRSIEDTEVEDVHHLIQKRQARQGGNQWRPPTNGGSQGGNPWKPPPTTQRPQCGYDSQCPSMLTIIIKHFISK